MYLYKKYPPSESCSCSECQSYCTRPGWWLPKEAEKAIAHGYAKRMMLEVSPVYNYAVLAPAFKGNEGRYALRIFSSNGCTFFNNQRCDLYSQNLQPLECRFCHHSRKGKGIQCHISIGNEWKKEYARKLIAHWMNENLKMGYFVSGQS